MSSTVVCVSEPLNNKVLPSDKTGLPWEVWQMILSWLSVVDLCRVARVCKTWNELVNSVDGLRWKELYLACNEWRHPFWPLNTKVEPPSWRQSYRDQYIATTFWKWRHQHEIKHMSCTSLFKRSSLTKTIHVGAGLEHGSLKSALSVANAYDRIVVHPGIYDEQFEITAKIPFELIGDGELGSIILVVGIQQIALTTRLSNLVLRAPWFTSFIVMINSGYLQIDKCILEDGMICASSPSTVHIKFCTFRHATVILQHMNSSIIENCEFSQSYSANVIIEGQPKSDKNWTYSYLREQTDAIFHQKRSMHRKKHGLKTTTSMTSTLHSSFTSKSLATGYSSHIYDTISHDPSYNFEEPGATFLHPNMISGRYLGSDKDGMVGCGDLQSMYQEPDDPDLPSSLLRKSSLSLPASKPNQDNKTNLVISTGAFDKMARGEKSLSQSLNIQRNGEEKTISGQQLLRKDRNNFDQLQVLNDNGHKASKNASKSLLKNKLLSNTGCQFEGQGDSFPTKTLINTTGHNEYLIKGAACVDYLSGKHQINAENHPSHKNETDRTKLKEYTSSGAFFNNSDDLNSMILYSNNMRSLNRNNSNISGSHYSKVEEWQLRNEAQRRNSLQEQLLLDPKGENTSQNCVDRLYSVRRRKNSSDVKRRMSLDRKSSSVSLESSNLHRTETKPRSFSQGEEIEAQSSHNYLHSNTHDFSGLYDTKMKKRERNNSVASLIAHLDGMEDLDVKVKLKEKIEIQSSGFSSLDRNDDNDTNPTANRSRKSSKSESRKNLDCISNPINGVSKFDEKQKNSKSSELLNESLFSRIQTSSTNDATKEVKENINHDHRSYSVHQEHQQLQHQQQQQQQDYHLHPKSQQNKQHENNKCLNHNHSQHQLQQDQSDSSSHTNSAENKTEASSFSPSTNFSATPSESSECLQPLLKKHPLSHPPHLPHLHDHHDQQHPPYSNDLNIRPNQNPPPPSSHNSNFPHDMNPGYHEGHHSEDETINGSNDDISILDELDTSDESDFVGNDSMDSSSSSDTSGDDYSANYTWSGDDFSSSEESVIMLPHLRLFDLNPDMDQSTSPRGVQAEVTSINSDCTRPVPVNISEDEMMSSFVDRIQGVLIHQCRMNHSKGGVMVNVSAHAIISECEINNVGYGIRCINSARVVILKNKIHHCRTSGIFMRLKASGLIAGNDVHSNSEAGIDIRKMADPLVQYNQIHHGKRSGVVVLGSGRGQIKKNDIFSNSEAGVYILYGGNPTVSENYIYEGRAAGVAINAKGKGYIVDNVIRGNRWGGVDIRNSSCPVISGNSIISGLSDGVVVGVGGKGNIENNKITGNSGSGIWMMSAKHLNIHGNQICCNGHCGILMLDKTTTNVESHLNQLMPGGLTHHRFSQYEDNFAHPVEPKEPYAMLQYNNISHNKSQGIVVEISEEVHISHNVVHGNLKDGVVLLQDAISIVEGNGITHNTGNGLVTSNRNKTKIIGNGIYDNTLHGVLCQNECVLCDNDVVGQAKSAIMVDGNSCVEMVNNRLSSSAEPAVKSAKMSKVTARQNKLYDKGGGDFVCDGEFTFADNSITRPSLLIEHARKSHEKDSIRADFLHDPPARPHAAQPPPTTSIPTHRVTVVTKVMMPSAEGCEQGSKLCHIL